MQLIEKLAAVGAIGLASAAAAMLVPPDPLAPVPGYRTAYTIAIGRTERAVSRGEYEARLTECDAAATVVIVDPVEHRRGFVCRLDTWPPFNPR